LTPGRDGLQFIRELVADASRVLRTGGRLLVELGLGQAVEARRLLDPALWDRIEVLADMQGIERLLIARRVPR
jgi:release factor glutamine methyltransferase